MSKTRASCFIRGSKHPETIKALGQRPRAFICFSVFGTPGEILVLVFDILRLYPQFKNMTYIRSPIYIRVDILQLKKERRMVTSEHTVVPRPNNLSALNVAREPRIVQELYLAFFTKNRQSVTTCA